MTGTSPIVGFCSVAGGVWGAERSMMTLARELRSQGVEPILLCVSEDVARVWKREVGTDATVVQLDSRRANQRVHLNVRMWAAAAKRQDLAAVVAFSYVLAAGGSYYRLRRRKSTRGLMVLDLHDNLEGPRGRLLLRLVARAFDAVVSVSRHTDGQLDGLRVGRSVIYRPVLPPPVVGAAGPGDAFRVGVIGRLDPQKKIHLAVEAVADLGAPYCLVLRGESADGGDADFSRDLVARAEQTLGPRLRFDGPVEWKSVLQGLDVLVVCNDAEPMGRTVAEAQLAGLLVVVPSTGGSSELVEHGVTGLVYQAADSSALASVLEEAAHLGHRREDITSTARDVATERHDVESYAVRYLAAVGLPWGRPAT